MALRWRGPPLNEPAKLGAASSLRFFRQGWDAANHNRLHSCRTNSIEYRQPEDRNAWSL